MIIVASSDTHFRHKRLELPPGDVFVHSGDMLRHGALEELEDFNRWLGTLPHRVKIIIAGNHDWCFERENEAAREILTEGHYLQDDELVVDGVKFYGSPWQPWFFNWAFNLQRGKELKEKWDKIPSDCDVLITHGPPYGHGDETVRGEKVGCRELLKAVERIKPRLHFFGHIHEGAGVTSNEHTQFVNASFLDVGYKVAALPRVMTL